ncbi:MAG: DEAD/DEAH box helicase, partial [Rhodobacteraceae bacterium]|nr:DEAD/DEAH box helicase [Paracoccaceae bacterium]
MTFELDPIRFKNNLGSVLARYISTAAPVSSARAPNLSREIASACAKAGLVKGPFVESLPDFGKGGSIAQLVNDGTLHQTWSKLASTPEGRRIFERPLHIHQAAAICRDENYLVATGTGSGKTEAFLIPLVDDLIRRGGPERAGVRVILVYPLNALANDQMNRIAKLLFRDLGDPGITLGRFTGQVRATASRAEEEIRIRETPTFQRDFPDSLTVPRNWLLSRFEMLAGPPHILITNYAMLEHILLLPRNRSLLDGADIRWLILDEIHSYSGAQAIEVAFLLRKLKARLGVKPGAIRCVGTSASLDVSRLDDLARFAEDLFGETFSSGDGSVIIAKRQLHPALQSGSEKPAARVSDWIRLGEVLSKLREGERFGVENEKYLAGDWNNSVRAAGLDEFVVDETLAFGDGLIGVLAQRPEVRAVAHALKNRVLHFEDLAKRAFASASEADDARRALAALISVGVLAKPSIVGAFPLLPARYHLAASGIEGVALRLSADDSEHWDQFRLTRSGTHINESPAYQLLVCRNCGEPYIEAWDDGRALNPRVDMSPNPTRRVLRLTAAGQIAVETDEIPTGGGNGRNMISFNPTNGRLVDGPGEGILSLEQVPMREDPDERRYYAQSCLSCGYRDRRWSEPVTSIHPGDDALATVATQELIEAIPAPAGRSTEAPMKGRNLLVFADNRQDAAFFAPFFERTARDMAIRAAIMKALHKDHDEPLDVRSVRDVAWLTLRRQGFRMHDRRNPDPMSATAAKDHLLGLMVAEFCTGPLRVSLESLG